jgi:hypothetical protein
MRGTLEEVLEAAASAPDAGPEEPVPDGTEAEGPHGAVPVGAASAAAGRGA